MEAQSRTDMTVQGSRQEKNPGVWERGNKFCKTEGIASRRIRKKPVHLVIKYLGEPAGEVPDGVVNSD